MDGLKSDVTMRHIRAVLFPFPFVCFTLCLATDLAYWLTDNVQWETFSVWLLTAGLVMAGFGIATGAIDIIWRGQHDALLPSPARFAGYAVALVLSLVNAFIHSRDGYTAVVPSGIALSAIVVLILVVTSWGGVAVSYRHVSNGSN